MKINCVSPILAIALCSGGAVLGHYAWLPPKPQSPAQQVGTAPSELKALKQGPWGDMLVQPFFLEPPENCLMLKMVENQDTRWHFDNYTEQRVTALFEKAELNSVQRQQLLDKSKWQREDGAILVPTNSELLLSLSTNSRKIIYMALMDIPDNPIGKLRTFALASKFDETYLNSGLPDETVQLVKKLSFPYAKLQFFCDLPLVMKTLDSYELKVRLMKTLLRKPTMLAKLRVTEESDISRLVDYWSGPRHRSDLMPMLESLAQLQGGARISLLRLLPTMAQDKIFTFSAPSNNPEDAHKDCHWTALNFFLAEPNQDFTDPKKAAAKIMNDYYRVSVDPKFGDLQLIAKEDGSIIHSSIYIADNVVYTKNSAVCLDPYILMSTEDMMAVFSAQVPEDHELSLLTYRRK